MLLSTKSCYQLPKTKLAKVDIGVLNLVPTPCVILVYQREIENDEFGHFWYIFKQNDEARKYLDSDQLNFANLCKPNSFALHDWLEEVYLRPGRKTCSCPAVIKNSENVWEQCTLLTKKMNESFSYEYLFVQWVTGSTSRVHDSTSVNPSRSMPKIADKVTQSLTSIPRSTILYGYRSTSIFMQNFLRTMNVKPASPKDIDAFQRLHVPSGSLGAIYDPILDMDKICVYATQSAMNCLGYESRADKFVFDISIISKYIFELGLRGLSTSVPKMECMVGYEEMTLNNVTFSASSVLGGYFLVAAHVESVTRRNCGGIHPEYAQPSNYQVDNYSSTSKVKVNDSSDALTMALEENPALKSALGLGPKEVGNGSHETQSNSTSIVRAMTNHELSVRPLITALVLGIGLGMAIGIAGEKLLYSKYNIVKRGDQRNDSTGSPEKGSEREGKEQHDDRSISARKRKRHPSSLFTDFISLATDSLSKKDTSKKIEMETANAMIQAQPVGILRSCFRECRGTPRQGLYVPGSRGLVKLFKHISPHTLDGLAQYSHAWVVFAFHENNNKSKVRDSRSPSKGKTFRAKVRVPALQYYTAPSSPPTTTTTVQETIRIQNREKKNDSEESTRKKAKQKKKLTLGLFATRTPHRPNPIGITLVKLEKIEPFPSRNVWISGLDLVDGTPILDIKPYVKAYDAIPSARNPPWCDLTSENQEEKKAIEIPPALPNVVGTKKPIVGGQPLIGAQPPVAAMEKKKKQPMAPKPEIYFLNSAVQTIQQGLEKKRFEFYGEMSEFAKANPQKCSSTLNETRSFCKTIEEILLTDIRPVSSYTRKSTKANNKIATLDSTIDTIDNRNPERKAYLENFRKQLASDMAPGFKERTLHFRFDMCKVEFFKFSLDEWDCIQDIPFWENRCSYSSAVRFGAATLKKKYPTHVVVVSRIFIETRQMENAFRRKTKIRYDDSERDAMNSSLDPIKSGNPSHAGMDLSLDDLARKNYLDSASAVRPHDNEGAIEEHARSVHAKHRARAERFEVSYVQPKVNEWLVGQPGAKLTSAHNCLPPRPGKEKQFKGQLSIELGNFSYTGTNTCVVWANLHNGRFARCSLNLCPENGGQPDGRDFSLGECFYHVALVRGRTGANQPGSGGENVIIQNTKRFGWWDKEGIEIAWPEIRKPGDTKNIIEIQITAAKDGFAL
eukprot:g724.t1